MATRDPWQNRQDFTEFERKVVRAISPYTMTSPERLVSLCRAVEYLVLHDIQGDFVECGVWRGGSMMAAALTLLELKAATRDLHLFDTFEGMPPPDSVDVSLDGVSAQSQLETSDPATSYVWAVSQLDEVKANMGKTNYDPAKVHFVQGKVEETLPDRAPQQISLLRLDTDWYASTYHELQTLYPRLSQGGVLIIDDYGHWQGARRAVDQYIKENKLKIFLHRIDYTGRIAVKLEASQS